MTIPSQSVNLGNQQVTLAGTSVNIDKAQGYLGNLKALPTGAIQINGGTVFGTNIAVRFFPSVDIKNLGKFSMWGIGFIHNISVWFPNPLPIDLGVGYFYQKLKVGDIFNSDANQFGIYASKTFSIFTPYVGLTTEKSNTTISYTYHAVTGDTGTNISFQQNGDNSTGAVVGLSLNLYLFKVNVDYKAAKINTLSAGLTFGN
jgi:hypothetical protein